MENQEILDKLGMIQREDNAYSIEPFIAEEYGSDTWIRTILIKSDVYSAGMDAIIKEFNHYFFDAKHGLVIG